MGHFSMKISASPGSDLSANQHTGAFLAAIRVGPLVFQQWSAPIKFGEHRILFGRIDGRLSIIDLNDKVLLAFISLAKGKLKFEPVPSRSVWKFWVA